MFHGGLLVVFQFLGFRFLFGVSYGGYGLCQESFGVASLAAKWQTPARANTHTHTHTHSHNICHLIVRNVLGVACYTSFSITRNSKTSLISYSLHPKKTPTLSTDRPANKKVVTMFVGFA